MTTTKTLMLGAAVALSMSAGAAMAQDAGPATDYWGQKNLDALNRQSATMTNTSDVSHARSFWLHSDPVQNTGILGGDGAGG